MTAIPLAILLLAGHEPPAQGSVVKRLAAGAVLLVHARDAGARTEALTQVTETLASAALGIRGATHPEDALFYSRLLLRLIHLGLAPEILRKEGPSVESAILGPAAGAAEKSIEAVRALLADLPKAKREILDRALQTAEKEAQAIRGRVKRPKESREAPPDPKKGPAKDRGPGKSAPGENY